MLFSSLLLQSIALKLSLCAIDQEKIPFFFEPIEPEFNDMIKSYNVPKIFFEGYQIDGQDTLISMFEKVRFIESFRFAGSYDTVMIKEMRFTDAVYSNLHLAIKKSFGLRPKEFLQHAIDSHFAFQWFVLYAGSWEKCGGALSSFCHFLFLIETSFEEMNDERKVEYKKYAKSFFLRFSTIWTSDQIKLLLETPWGSGEEFKERRRIIALHLKLFASVCLHVSPILNLGLVDEAEIYENYKYGFLYHNFSVNDKGEINFQNYQTNFEYLELFAGIPQRSKSPQCKIYSKIENRLFDLFLLYKRHYFNPPVFQKNIPIVELKTLIISLNFDSKFHVFRKFSKVYRMFLRPPEEQIFNALPIIRESIFDNLDKTLPSYNLIEPHFSEYDLLKSSKIAINILKDYAEKKIIGLHDLDWGVSRWKIKIYLHLLKYYKKVPKRK
jgi:hypothetical protein